MPELSRTIAYRAVVGAVHNTMHAHPRWSVPRDFARSVAKRAAGTLLAHGGLSVLAVSGRSDQKQKLTHATSALEQAKAPRELRLLSRMHRELTRMIGRPGADDERRAQLIAAARAIKLCIQTINQLDKGPIT